MKTKTLTIILAAGISASAFGQGVLLQNVGTGVGGTNGAVYMHNGTKFDGLNYNLGVAVSGGPVGGSLSPVGLGTYRVGTDPKGYTGLGLGTFQLGVADAAVNIPGVAAGGVATVKLDIWFDGVGGLFPSFAAAVVQGALWDSVTFLQRTSNEPLVSPPLLDGMPNIVLDVPEPSTQVLAGLGLASLLMLRRRK